MATLYRKYRPQNFEEVVGQNHIKLTLQQEIISGKTAHAYIFCGPRAVGKTTLARVFAKAINCTQKKENSADPCNKCKTCIDITAGKALDIIEIDAASHTGVENVRENIIANALVIPTSYKYKVFIIDEVHMLSASAFNALLKIIEEPPKYVVFILCTTEIHKVSTTIISRCQRFDFKKINTSDMLKKLSYVVKNEKIIVSKEILESIARQAEGHMRDAESMLGQIMAIGEKEITQEEADLVIPRNDLNEVLNLLSYLAKKDAANAIRLINKLIGEGVNFKTFLNDCIEFFRKLLLIKISPSLSTQFTNEYGEALEIRINESAKLFSLEQIIDYTEKFILAKSSLKDYFIEQLPIELVIAEICSSQSTVNFIPKVAETKTPNDTPIINKMPINKPVDNFVNTDNEVNLSIEQIMAKWNEVLAKIKQHNHSLSFILRVCQPRNISGNQLNIAFKYKFHKERVGEVNIKNIVEQVIAQVYGVQIMINPIVDETIEVASNKLVSDEPANLNSEVAVTEKNIKKEDEANQGTIDNLLKTFGGKVV